MIMRRRIGMACAVLVAVVAGVGSASALVGGNGQDTINGPEAVQPDGQGAAVVTLAPDPRGRQPWAVRVYRSQAGLTCPEAGRTDDGDFGQVDSDGKFRPLDIEAAGSCADLDKAPMSLAINHYPANGTEAARAVIFGVVSPGVRSLSLKLAGGTRPLAVTSNAFLAVTTESDLEGAALDAMLQDGSNKTYPLRPTSAPPTESATP
jgi:hypothetical protein